MQAYAKAELIPAEPDFNRRQARRDEKAAIEIASEPQVRAGRGTSSALAALVLDELDENALEVLAMRLAPHLHRLEDRNPAVAHVAYTVHSLATELGVSPKTIRCAIARGELVGIKRGSRWIIPADAVKEWATASASRHTRSHACLPRAPKTAGPSLRSVLCAGHNGGLR